MIAHVVGEIVGLEDDSALRFHVFLDYLLVLLCQHRIITLIQNKGAAAHLNGEHAFAPKPHQQVLGWQIWLKVQDNLDTRAMIAQLLKLQESQVHLLSFFVATWDRDLHDEFLHDVHVFEVSVQDPSQVVHVRTILQAWKVQHNFFDAKVDGEVNFLRYNSLRPLTNMLKR